jgi:Flp pilus assembly protein TadG
MDKGQSLVEFAISLLLLLILLSGLAEFGVALFQYVQLRDAAQEGAVYGSACDCSIADIEQRVINSSDTPIDLAFDTGVSIQVTADRAGVPVNPELSCEGDAMTVRVQYLHKIFMPFVPKMLGSDYINLTASVTNTVLVPVC